MVNQLDSIIISRNRLQLFDIITIIRDYVPVFPPPLPSPSL